MAMAFMLMGEFSNLLCLVRLYSLNGWLDKFELYLIYIAFVSSMKQILDVTAFAVKAYIGAKA